MSAIVFPRLPPPTPKGGWMDSMSHLIIIGGDVPLFSLELTFSFSYMAFSVRCPLSVCPLIANALPAYQYALID